MIDNLFKKYKNVKDWYDNLYKTSPTLAQLLVLVVICGVILLLIYLVPGKTGEGLPSLFAKSEGLSSLWDKTSSLSSLLKIKINETTKPSLETFMCQYMLANNLQNMTLAGNYSVHNVTLVGGENITVSELVFGDVTCWQDEDRFYDCFCIRPIR